MVDIVLMENIATVYMDGQGLLVTVVRRMRTTHHIHILTRFFVVGKCPGFTDLICYSTTCPTAGSAPVCECPGHAKGNDCSGGRIIDSFS